MAMKKYNENVAFDNHKDTGFLRRMRNQMRYGASVYFSGITALHNEEKVILVRAREAKQSRNSYPAGMKKERGYPPPQNITSWRKGRALLPFSYHGYAF